MIFIFTDCEFKSTKSHPFYLLRFKYVCFIIYIMLIKWVEYSFAGFLSMLTDFDWQNFGCVKKSGHEKKGENSPEKKRMFRTQSRTVILQCLNFNSSRTKSNASFLGSPKTNCVSVASNSMVNYMPALGSAFRGSFSIDETSRLINPTSSTMRPWSR